MTQTTRTNTRRDLLRYGVATVAGAAAARILPRSLSVAHADEAGVGAGQSRAGLISSAPATTFKERVAKINASDAFFEALAKQPDKGPIINLNYISCRPRGNAKVYEAYGAVAGKEIAGVGGSIAQYAIGVTDANADYGFSDKWDIVDLPVYPRRKSYLQLQKSAAYQGAIPDRVAGTFERLLYVLSDDKPLLRNTKSSIAKLHKTKKPLPYKDGQVAISELIAFKGAAGRDAFKRYAAAFAPILKKHGGTAWLSVRAEMPIVCEQLWNHWTLITLPSMNAFETMFQSDEWQEANGNRLEALERHLTVASKPVKIPV